MNELDTFTINFVTEGIDKLLDGMDKLNKQMDKVDTGFTKAGSKGDSFFNKFIGWGEKIGSLILGFAGIYKAIRDTMNGADEILNLHKTADDVGRTAKEVEVLGLALQRFNPGMSLSAGYSSAGSFYEALNKLRLDEARLSPGSDFMKELNYAGTSAILATDSDQEIVRKLRVGVQNYLNTQDAGTAEESIKRLLSSAGISYKEMGGLFRASDADFNLIMSEMNKKAWRYDPKYQQEAQNLNEAKLTLSETWKKLTDDLLPIVTDLINCFNNMLNILKPLLDLIMPVVNMLLDIINNVLSRLGKGVQGAVSEFDAARALGKLADSSWWEGKTANEIKPVIELADAFLQNPTDYAKEKWDIEKQKKILDVSWKTLNMLEQSGLTAMPIRNNNSNNLEVNNYQTFNGYREQDVGDAAKKGAKEGVEEGSYYVIQTNQ